MPVQLARTVGVCLVVALAVSAFATGTASTAVGVGDLDGVVLDHDGDDDEENDDQDDGDGDDQGEEGEIEDDGGNQDDGDDEGDEAVATFQRQLADRAAGLDRDCNESDHDRGHGNDCDGEDEDNPAESDLPDDPTPTPVVSTPIPTPSPTPPVSTPTGTPPESPTFTPTPTSTPVESSGSAAGTGGGGSGAADGSAGAGPREDTPDDDVTVVSGSHEIGGFRAIRSVSTNQSVIVAGERVEIVVTVENVNDEPIVVPVELTVFGEVVAVENVTVSGEETERVRFVQAFDAPGTYHPSVGDRSATVRVEPRTATTKAETTIPTGQVGFDALAALLGIALVVLATRRR